jgi:hypothetical protein
MNGIATRSQKQERAGVRVHLSDRLLECQWNLFRGVIL